MDKPVHTAPVAAIARHRLTTDGQGVTTLVAFAGCPLRCRYCLNPHTLDTEQAWPLYDAQRLYDAVRIDALYFLATQGGITFGGGEPALRSGLIAEFRALCGTEWRLTVETSLNVAGEHIEALLPVVDEFIIDIKDMDPEIYRSYTGRPNDRVIDNLRPTRIRRPHAIAHTAHPAIQRDGSRRTKHRTSPFAGVLTFRSFHLPHLKSFRP